MVGFEPTTLCSQSRYATKLRYTQMLGVSERFELPSTVYETVALPIKLTQLLAEVVGIEPTIIGSKPIAFTSWLHLYSARGKGATSLPSCGLSEQSAKPHNQIAPWSIGKELNLRLLITKQWFYH